MNSEVAPFPKGYFKDAKLYAGGPSSSSPLPKYRRRMHDFIMSMPRNAKVLDAGCGNSKFSRIIMKLRPDIELHSVDQSDVSGFVPSGVKFTQTTIEDMTKYLKPDYFDCVFCMHVIEHVLYPMGMVEALRKVMKPGGRLYLETPNWSRALCPWIHPYFWDDYTHVRIFTKRTIERLFDDHGLDIQTLVSVSTATLFTANDTAEGVRNFYKSQKSERRRRMSPLKLPFVLFGKVVARVISLFLKDFIVVVASKRDNT